MIDRALFLNRWLWFHMLGGGVYGKMLQAIDVANWIILLSLLAVAVLWEVYEYLSDDVSKIYGSVINFIYDGIGDITGAIIICLLVIL